MKRLNLCEEHKQESNQSHFDTSNCDYCRLRNCFDELLTAIRMMSDLRDNGLIDSAEYGITKYSDINDRLHELIAKCEEVEGI